MTAWIERSRRVGPRPVTYLAARLWAALHARFDTTVAADVPEEVLRGRLTARWKGYGLHPSKVRAKVEDNDLPNGRFVVSNSVPAEFTIAN